MDHIKRFLTISFAYLLSFWFSSFVLSGVSLGGSVSSISFASLLFLPHGVRVISAWLYGWRSVAYLAPAIYITHIIRFSGQEMSVGRFLMPIFGVVCVAATFEIIAWLGADLRLKGNLIAPWRAILIVGALASLINALGTNLLAGNSIDTALQYLIGDISGMITLFLILMFAFRQLRLAGY